MDPAATAQNALAEQFSEMESPRSPRPETPPQPPNIVRKSNATPIQPKTAMTRVGRLEYVIKQLKELPAGFAGTKQIFYYIGFLLRGMYWSGFGVPPQPVLEGAIDLILLEHIVGSGALLKSEKTRKAWETIEKRLNVDKLDTSYWKLETFLFPSTEALKLEELDRKSKELVGKLEMNIVVAQSLDDTESRSFARRNRASKSKNKRMRASKTREGTKRLGAAGGKDEETKTQSDFYSNMLAARMLNLRF